MSKYIPKKKPDDKQCLQCGKIFTPSKNDSRIVFCCTDCRLEYRKATGYMDNYYHANLKKWQDRNDSREHKDAKNAARRKKYAEDAEYREHQKQLVREYNRLHPETKQRQRAKHYGLTLEEKESIYESQGGRCAICGGDGTNGKWDTLYIDHDHKTGKVRGLLCARCNFALGQFDDDISRLEKAAEYLRTNGILRKECDKNNCKM